MINIITNLLLIHVILLLAHTMILPLLVVHPNILIVLVIAPLVIITPLLNDINFHTILLLNHVLIATVVDRTQIQKTTLIFNINPLLILLNHLHQFSIVIFSTELKFEINLYHPNTPSSQ